MQKKIIINPGRELTNQEINEIERKKIIFSTENIISSGHYDRFAGVRISGRTMGKYDDISCVMCKVKKIEDKENVYEIVYEETDSVKGLDREYREGVYKIQPFEEQLKYLQKTQLSNLLEDANVIEQIKAKHEEARKNSYFSTHEFSRYKQEKEFWKETLDILSNMNLIEKAQVEEITDDGSKRILSILKDVQKEEYMLVEMPCNIIVKFNENKLKFSECDSTKDRLFEETKEEVINKISKINTLLNLIPYHLQNKSHYTFLIPEKIYSIEELEKLIAEIEKIQLEDIDLDEISIEEIDGLIGSNKRNYVFESIVEKHDVEYILKRITNTNDNKLKKELMKIFSKKDGEYTEEQIEIVKKTLIELLKDEKGWEGNADVIAGFSKNFKSTLNFAEKMEILRMSIESHNNYCEHEEFPNLSGETYKNMREKKRQQHQISMKLSTLVNELFTGEEQSALAGELISQKDYQAMIMILKECEFDSKQMELPREDDKYSEISTEQKGKMVEELLKYRDDAPEGWLRGDKTYDLQYIDDYLKNEKQRIKTNAFKQIVSKKLFYIVERGAVEEPDEQQLKCFEDYREGIEAYIDVKEAINSIKKGKLHIDIPAKYMGLMIGKQGSNIKRLQEQIRSLIDGGDIKIILDQQKEGHIITLQEIQTFIEQQKTSELGEV